MVTMQLEAMLFAVGKPLSRAALKNALNISDEVFAEAIADLKTRFNTETSGIHLIETDAGELQFVTNPAASELIAALTKQESTGELTRPSLETLTIIAYRGPVTKPEIEQIRGVNCTLILRNLLLRGLIEEKDDVEKLQPVYSITTDFLRHLGIHSVQELPDFEELHGNEKIASMLAELAATSSDAASV